MPEMLSPPALLTIAIPTYRRPHCVEARLKELVPQLNGFTKIVVQDNASPEDCDYDSIITAALTQTTADRLCFRRNQNNIGAVANVLRLVENCDTEWVWLLGDDDITAGNAVEMVQAAIRENPDAHYIEFSSPWGSYSEKRTAFGVAGLAKSVATFRNLLYLSSGVYRAEPLKRFLHVGYDNASTLAPHVALLLASLGPGEPVVFLPDRLITGFEERFHWAPLDLYLRLPFLSDVLKSPEEAKSFRLLFAEAFPLRTLFFNLWHGVDSVEGASNRAGAFTRAAMRNFEAIASPRLFIEFLAEATALRWPNLTGRPMVRVGRALSAMMKSRSKER